MYIKQSPDLIMPRVSKLIYETTRGRGASQAEGHPSQSIIFKKNAQTTDMFCLRLEKYKGHSTLCIAGIRVNFRLLTICVNM